MPTAAKIAKYKKLLGQLLPPGRLFDPLNQPVLQKLLEATAVEFARFDDRIDDALREADPRKALELLPEWERLVGLPDECTPLGVTLEDRRNQVTQKLTSVGGISLAYYEFLTAQLGFPSTVTDWKEFQVGRSQVGQPLSNDFDIPFQVGQSQVGQQLQRWGWLFMFNVEMPASAADVFQVGLSTVGEPLVSLSNDLIACTIKKLKPAHTGVTFSFKP